MSLNQDCSICHGINCLFIREHGNICEQGKNIHDEYINNILINIIYEYICIKDSLHLFQEKLGLLGNGNLYFTEPTPDKASKAVCGQEVSRTGGSRKKHHRVLTIAMEN